MTGLVCHPSIVPPAPTTPEVAIAGDGFFPEIDPAQLRLQLRLRDGTTPERLREAVLAAMITVGNDLAAWADAQRAAGHATLDAVSSAEIGGEPRLVVLYRRAIGAFVRAELIEQLRDVDTTGEGLKRAGELDPTIENLRRDGLHAIRDILGVGRCTIELL